MYGLKMHLSAVKENKFIANLRNYLENTSLHGCRYLVMQQLTASQRVIWIILLLGALTGTACVSFILANKFKDTLLSTVVETTNYHVSEISFPAVTLCNNLRVDFQKFDAGMERFLPLATNESKKTFLALLQSMEILDFGSFDELEYLKEAEDLNTSTLKHLKLVEVAEFMSYDCEDLFVRCWWRNKYLDCCELFTRQKSEYGFCYSFNSASSAPSPKVNRSFAFPWRVSSFNEWSALRVEMKIKHSMYANESRPNGLLYSVHDPYEWPNIARFIPEGTTNAIKVTATSFYVSPNVHDLPISVRNCIYRDKVELPTSTIMRLKSLPYLRANCMSECRQRYMFKYCNCSLEIFFDVEGEFPACDIDGLLCLNTYNEIFNYEVPPKKSEYFDDQEGLECPCLQDCSRVEYRTEAEAFLAMASKSNDSVTLDFHFESGELVRYRTDIEFDWVDLMVAFGGIAGLFLGASLLSGTEIIYYFTVGMINMIKQSAERYANRKLDKGNMDRGTFKKGENGDKDAIGNGMLQQELKPRRVAVQNIPAVVPRNTFGIDRREWGYHYHARKQRF